MSTEHHDRIAGVQKILRDNQVDAWLLYDFRKNNPICQNLLQVPHHLMQSRRLFYLIPAKGSPKKLVHAIERYNLDHLPGDREIYLPWKELENGLHAMLKPYKTVAMEYSPDNAVPYVSLVDAGMVELVRKAGVEVVSSGDLVQHVDAVWSEKQFAMHLEASDLLIKTVQKAFGFIKSRITAGEKLTEYEVQEFMLAEFEKNGFETEYPPNCSVNANSGNPHYEPTAEVFSEIREGDFVLIDLWAKKKAPGAVYADYTWVGFVGRQVPEKYQKIFDIVRAGRDAAVEFLKEQLAAGKEVFGWQVDDACRSVIDAAGYGKQFMHRTGHSIGEEVHGNGANIDNLETKDNRRIINGTCFSIEPGIYFIDEFGIRSEIDVYVSESGEVHVTGTPVQTEVIPVLK